MKRHYGDRSTCTRCSQDIEWTGRKSGWRDRGGDRECGVYLKGDKFVRPDGEKHTIREVKQ